MALSNKKIKYIINTAGQKSIKDLSHELGVSEQEIEEILKGISPQDKRAGEAISLVKSNNGESLLSEHGILILFQAILIFIAPLISMNSGWYDFANLAQGLYIQSISGFMVFFWLLDCFISKKFEIKKCNLYFPILGILLWSGLSFFWSTNISECAEIMSLWVACAVIFFVLYNMIRNSLDFTIIVSSIILSMSFLIVIGMIQVFNPSFSFYNQVISPSGSFGNKNMFCDYLIIVLPLCFYFFFNGSDKTWLIMRIISAILFGAGILLVIFSMTRAGMLTAPILVFLLFLFLIVKKSDKLLIGIILAGILTLSATIYFAVRFNIPTSIIIIIGVLFLILVLTAIIFSKKTDFLKEVFSQQKVILLSIFFLLFSALLAIYLFNNKGGNQSDALGKRIKSIFVLPEKDKEAFDKTIKDEKLQPVSDSTTIRLITWANTLKMIQDKPLHGFGLYNWQIHYGEYRRAYFNDPTYQPGLVLAQLHNDYLQIFADLGLIGFLLFAWLIISVLAIFKKIFFTAENNLETKLKALSLILCVVAFGIICNFSFLIVKSVPTLLLFSYFALIANLYYFTNMSKAATPSVYTFKNKIAGFLLLPILTISIAVTDIEVNRGVADQLFKTAMDSHKTQKYDIVIETCEKILAIDPLHYKTHFVIANAFMAKDNFEKAVYHIEYGLQFYPNDLYALFQAGTIYVKQLKNILEGPNPDKNTIKLLEEKTLFWYGKAFAIREDFGKAWNNQGFLYERRSFRLYAAGNKKEGDATLKEAENCFDKALLQDPSYTDALLNKANILQNTGRGQETIPIALRVLNISMQKLKEKEAVLQELLNSNFQKNSGKVNDAYTQKIAASQEYMASAPKAIFMLKVEYDKTKNYKAFLEVFDYEKDYLAQLLDMKSLSFRAATQELELAKKSASYLRMGTNLQQIESNYESQKQVYEMGLVEYYQKMSRLLIDMSDTYRLLGNQAESLSNLYKVIEMAQKSKDILEQESIARLQINAMYLSTVNKDLISKFPIIEENFQKATFQGNQDLTNHKKAYEQQFKEAKKILKVE